MSKYTMKFLHEKKELKETLGLKDKGVLSEYNKKRRRLKLEKELELESNGFVTKSAYELVFGFKDSNAWFCNPNGVYRKYVDKYEYYRGTHAKKEIR